MLVCDITQITARYWSVIQGQLMHEASANQTIWYHWLSCVV